MTPASRAAWLAWGLVFGAALAVYAGNLGHGFVFDDESLILRNEAIRSPGAAGSLFLLPYRAPQQNDGLYRPLTVLSYAANHAVLGLAPLPFHLVNDVLHALNATLLAILVWRLLGRLCLAISAGLVFALHPVHTEAVAWVAGRSELLAACFTLLALLAATVPRGRTLPSRIAGAARVAAPCLLGLLSKENAIVAVPAVLALVVLSHPRPSETRERVTPSMRLPWPLLLALGTGCCIWWGLRARALGDAVVTIAADDNPLAAAATGPRIYTALAVFALGLRRLIWPTEFSVDYTPPRLQVLTSPLHLDTLAGLCALAAIVAAVALAVRRRPILAFWGGFGLAAWLPVSNLLFPIGTPFGERLLYLPSSGYSVLLAVGLERLPRHLRAVATFALLAGFAVLTFQRNAQWESNATLFRHEVEHRPCSARSLVNYGKTLESDAPAGALALYREAVALVPDYAHARRALGTLLLERGDATSAVEQLAAAERLRPGHVPTLINLGVAHATLGRSEDAARCFETVLRIEPGHPRAIDNLRRLRSGRAEPTSEVEPSLDRDTR